MVWGNVIQAVGGLAATALGNKGARDVNSAGRDEARLNREWQEELSNTAVQRRMADLKKAGINPLLAGQYDASTPAGSAFSNFQNPMLAASQAFGNITSGMATANQAEAEVEKKASEIVKINQEVENLKETQQLTKRQASQVEQLTRQAWEATNNLQKEGAKLDYENIVRSVITEFKQDNPSLTILQEFGVDGGTLADFITSTLGKVLGKGKTIINQNRRGR